jgi:hypothetical protein
MATREAAREGGNSMVFTRDRRTGEPRPLAIAAERECRDGVVAVLASRVPSLLDGSTMKKSPKIASMLVLRFTWRCPYCFVPLEELLHSIQRKT